MVKRCSNIPYVSLNIMFAWFLVTSHSVLSILSLLVGFHDINMRDAEILQSRYLLIMKHLSFILFSQLQQPTELMKHCLQTSITSDMNKLNLPLFWTKSRLPPRIIVLFCPLLYRYFTCSCSSQSVKVWPLNIWLMSEFETVWYLHSWMPCHKLTWQLLLQWSWLADLLFYLNQ